MHVIDFRKATTDVQKWRANYWKYLLKILFNPTKIYLFESNSCYFAWLSNNLLKILICIPELKVKPSCVYYFILCVTNNLGKQPTHEAQIGQWPSCWLKEKWISTKILLSKSYPNHLKFSFKIQTSLFHKFVYTISIQFVQSLTTKKNIKRKTQL